MIIVKEMIYLSNYLDKERNPGWNELFFDLSYVVLVGKIAHILFKEDIKVIKLETVVMFLWIFCIQALVWMYYTTYMNYYGDENIKKNLYTFVLVICLVFTSLFMEDFKENIRDISILLSVVVITMSFMYTGCKDEIKENCEYAKFKIKVFRILSLLTLAVYFMNTNTIIIYTTVIYLVAAIIDEVYTKKHKVAKIDISHIMERMGIFMILVFGEAFLTLSETMKDVDDIYSLSVFIAFIVIIFGLWINYFTFLDEFKDNKYKKYSQILTLFSMTIFSSIIHHGFYQDLDIFYYEILTFVFILSFFAANAWSYKEITITKFILFYAILPAVVLSINAIIFHSYNITLIFLIVEIILTSVFIMKRKISHDNQKKN